MRVTVRLFARLRDIAGSAEVARDLPEGTTVRDVWRALVADHPALAPYESSVSAAVNADYARWDTTVSGGDEVAFLPPVSGGGGSPPDLVVPGVITVTCPLVVSVSNHERRVRPSTGLS